MIVGGDPIKKDYKKLDTYLQHIVDCNSQLIVSTSVTNSASDHHELVPQIENYQELYGELNK